MLRSLAYSIIIVQCTRLPYANNESSEVFDIIKNCTQ